MKQLDTSKVTSFTPERETVIPARTGIRRTLFSSHEESSSKKRCLLEPTTSTEPRKRRRISQPDKLTQNNALSPISEIIYAVDKMTTESELIADASPENVLPTIRGKHSDLNAISPEIVSIKDYKWIVMKMFETKWSLKNGKFSVTSNTLSATYTF